MVVPKKLNSFPTSSTFFGGRAFYAANDTVLFSQLLVSDKNLGRCYQDNDPTAEDSPDLLETDGGAIRILGASGIYRLEAIGSSLIVFANNGIWQISGEGGFTASSYSVTQISNEAAINSNTILKLPTSVLYATKRGFFVLQPDNISNTYTPFDISSAKIKPTFELLNKESLASMSLLYSEFDNKIYIGLNSDAQTYIKTLLIFDIDLQAWTIYDFSSNDDYSIVGFYASPESSVRTTEVVVTYNGEEVTYNGEEILANDSVTITQIPQIQFVSISDSEPKLSVLGLNRDDYRDFGEVSYPAYFVTASNDFGDFTTKKRIKNIHCLFEKTETGYTENEEGGLEFVNPSGCTVQIGWDFATVSSYSEDDRNIWSRPYSVYNFSRYESKSVEDIPAKGLRTLATRTGIRGSGNSAMFRFQAEAGKDCRILGWNVDVMSNSRS